MNEQQAMQVAEKAMADKIPLPVEICVRDAWLLVSALQLCTRHPHVSRNMKQHMLMVGQQFQDAIVEWHPEAEIVLEMGWDSDYDVPFEGQSS